MAAATTTATTTSRVLCSGAIRCFMRTRVVVPGDRFRQGTGLDRRGLAIHRPQDVTTTTTTTTTTSRAQPIHFLKRCYSLSGTRYCCYHTLNKPKPPRNQHKQPQSKTVIRRVNSEDMAPKGGSSSSSIQEGATASGIDFGHLSNYFPEASLWYVLAGITLTAVGRQHLIGELWEQLATRVVHHETSQRSDGVGGVESLKKAGIRLREGLMKMSVLLGYPRAINALSTLYNAQQRLSRLGAPSAVVHSAVFSILSEASPTRPYLISDQNDVNGSVSIQDDENTDKRIVNGSTSNNYARGLALFTQIYSTKHVPTLVHNLSVSSAGDLAHFAISRLYGDLLSDVSILDKKETGLACFATCLAMALGAGPLEQDLAKQIKGHMYGAKNLGASGDEIRGTTALVIKTWECVTGEHFRNAADSVKLVLEKAQSW